MKRLLLSVFALTLLGQAALAGSPMGVGLFVGPEYPVVQDDQSAGTVWGFKGRLKPITFLTFEPYLAFTNYGDPDMDEVIESIEGSKVNAFGIDALMGSGMGAPGLKVYLFAGFASYSVKNDDTDYDESNIGYSGGLGIEVGFKGGFSVEGRGRLVIVPSEGASKKSAALTVGANYHFVL